MLSGLDIMKKREFKADLQEKTLKIDDCRLDRKQLKQKKYFRMLQISNKNLLYLEILTKEQMDNEDSQIIIITLFTI